MLANREWSNYAHKRAALRVTVSTPTQRSTYFLSLPSTYSLSLIAASILLHWLISQSLFLARIAFYSDGVTFQRNLTNLGSSKSALIATIVWGCVMVAVCLAVVGFYTYPNDMPIGGTNSAVISAACHIKQRDGDQSQRGGEIVERPLQWGVTFEGTEDEACRCSFSDKEVEKPRDGYLYA
jgi:hypothetical protein